ncbi:MAG TPA: nucleotidyltransferase domain-containing protein [Flavipsychrobacter sp.]|nr:nucleotidyltransferase domain-containing protein [Flavipsychrobacter sp.]
MIKERLSTKDPHADIILFGSQARGDASIDSDWDILILTDKPILNHLKEEDYRNELFQIELETGEPISAIILSKQEWNNKYPVTPLYMNIQKEGIRL